MMKLRKEFEYFIKEGRFLTINFIERYIKFIVGIYNASSYVNNVHLDLSNIEFEACYSFQKREIVISFENIIQLVERTYNISFDFCDKDHIRKFNLKLLYAISHECYHAVQNKTINTYRETKEISRILIDSYFICITDFDLYNKTYRYMPIEINAEILGKLMVSRFINISLDKKTTHKNDSLIIQEVLNSCYIKDGENIVPAEKFYHLIDEQERYEDIIKTYSLTNFQKFALGFPTDEKYFSKISSLDKKTIDSMDIKRYFKK